MGLIFKDGDVKALSPKAARTRGILLTLPFAVMGVFALILLVHDGLLGGLNRQKAMGLLSAAIVCGGLIVLIFGINAKKMAMQAFAARKADDRAPWLRRKEWADGRISTSSKKPVVLVWVIVVFWCLVLAILSLVVLPTLFRHSHSAALLVMIFPTLGLAVIYFTFITTQAWRRFGDSIFEMEHFPAPAGTSLSGRILVKSKIQPEHGWQIRLSCVRRQTTGATNNRQAIEKVLWREDKWLRADLPRTDSGITSLPIFFNLPANLPESAASAEDGIHWKLETSATLRGPNYQATFEVPVFKLAEAPAPAEDLAQAYVVSLDSIRQRIPTSIEVKDLAAGGREFFFPSGRNPGFAMGATLVWAVWTGIIALLILKRAPLPFVLVFSLMDLLMAAFVVDLWFRRSRVVINSSGVKVEIAWPVYKKQQYVPAKQIGSIAADIGGTAGHALYYDLKVHAAGGKEFLLAKNLRHRPEADWLAGQMREALKETVKADKLAN
jgi:hypothetical protein